MRFGFVGQQDQPSIETESMAHQVGQLVHQIVDIENFSRGLPDLLNQQRIIITGMRHLDAFFCSLAAVLHDFFKLFDFGTGIDDLQRDIQTDEKSSEE